MRNRSFGGPAVGLMLHMEARKMRTGTRVFYGVTLVAGTMMATTGLDAMRHTGGTNLLNVASAATSADRSDTTATELSHAFRKATSNAMPGVVFIDIEQRR